jgi:hypothetical protein
MSNAAKGGTDSTSTTGRYYTTTTGTVPILTLLLLGVWFLIDPQNSNLLGREGDTGLSKIKERSWRTAFTSLSP